jgi:hypothetical protein
MAVNYSTEGYVVLQGVTTSGTFGTSGSTISWTGVTTGGDSDFNHNITDDDEDGLLDVGVDTFANPIFVFSGYTIESGGVDYPVFYYSTTNAYLVALPQNGTTQTLISAPGTSNVYQPEAPAYLCFAAGSRIATPECERVVEDLQIGDTILTSDGRSVHVKWIGRQTVSTRFGPAERLMPVRFAAGSLGEGLPQSDLTVTADHGMLVDGVICHAGALVNGTTIRRVPLSEMGETYTVYHIETEAHEIILANGAPAETFIDNVSRRVFDNYAEFEALYGDVPEMEELPYPRAMSARQVPGHLRNRLAVLLTA